jgi:hypothetical protein
MTHFLIPCAFNIAYVDMLSYIVGQTLKTLISAKNYKHPQQLHDWRL